MKKEYDFSKAKKGKFYKPLEELDIPIYLYAKVKKYYIEIARQKHIDINTLINNVLKKDIDLYKTMQLKK